MSSTETLADGPETWSQVAGVDWSWWDLWFCMICVTDHDGDWDALDAAIQKSRSDDEARWCHLVDLRSRLDQAGLSAQDLAGETLRTSKARVKIRKKVMDSTLYERHLTPAMRDLPSVRLSEQMESGSWSAFPRSPQPWYDVLAGKFDVNDRRYVYGDGWATQKMAYKLSDTVEKMLAKAGGDAAEQLAIRRAALRLYHDAAEGCDDSYGGLGEVAQQEIVTYAGSDWRTSGIAADVFWRDLLRWCISGSNYGLLNGVETEVLEGAQVHRDRELVDAILLELIADYTAARQKWPASEAEKLRTLAAQSAEPGQARKHA